MSKNKKKKSIYYIDNEEFYLDISNYLKYVEKCESECREVPRVTEKLGKSFFDLCYNISNGRQFRGYQYKEDLVSFALEDCIRGIRKFDYIKYKNPLAYFTTAAWRAMWRYMDQEKKDLKIKVASLIYGNSLGYDKQPGDLEMYPDNLGMDLSGEDWRENLDKIDK
jgi:DNA-directed RNA polymerase specialized sigma subunit